MPAENRVERLEHVLGRDVGEKAEPAAIDADEWNVACGDVARGVQQSAVAADSDHEVGAVSDLALVDVRGVGKQPVPHPSVTEARTVMPRLRRCVENLQRRLRDALLAEAPPQRDRLEFTRHWWIS